MKMTWLPRHDATSLAGRGWRGMFSFFIFETTVTNIFVSQPRTDIFLNYWMHLLQHWGAYIWVIVIFIHHR